MKRFCLTCLNICILFNQKHKLCQLLAGGNFCKQPYFSSTPLIPGANAFATQAYDPVDGTPKVKLFGDGEMFDVTTQRDELKRSTLNY
jgi:hypothetical protein